MSRSTSLAQLLIVCLSNILLLLTRYGDSCIFYTFNERRMVGQYITQNYTMTSFQDNCELLCYSNLDSCVAANVIRQSDGSYLCQFVSVSIQALYGHILEHSPMGKYFSRTNLEGEWCLNKLFRMMNNRKVDNSFLQLFTMHMYIYIHIYRLDLTVFGSFTITLIIADFNWQFVIRSL
jgi:hypothetical protein